MPIRTKGQGHGFPRNTEFGFNQHTGDTKRDEMDYGKANPLLNLRGPTGVPWIVHLDFSISARWLYVPQALVAFEKCYEKRNNPTYASYARRLGARLREEDRKLVCEKQFGELCKLTRKAYYLSNEKMAGMVQVHRESLAYLGELSRQCTRAIENGVILKSHVQDVRLTNPFDLKDILDSWGIPDTSDANLYGDFNVLPELHGTLASMWLREDDPQAAHVTDQLQSLTFYTRTH